MERKGLFKYLIYNNKKIYLYKFMASILVSILYQVEKLDDFLTLHGRKK